MIIYWALLAWTVVVALTWKKWFIFKVRTVDGRTKAKPLLASYLASFAPLVFIIGMRTEVADTKNYIETFNNLPTTFSEILSFQYKDRLFYQLSAVIKRFFPNASVWLLIIAFFQILFICLTIRRYSAMPGVSMFLFVASVEIAYMFNGMRQFLAVTLLFAGYRLLVEKKYIPYILLIILAAQFHATAYVMIFGLAVSFIKPWSKAMYVGLAAFTFAMIFLNPILSGMKIFFEDTEYGGRMNELVQTEGVNFIRALVALVPCVLGFFFKNNKALFSKREYAVAFNMSLLNAAFFVAASIVGGNLMARFAEYFTIFQLITFPAIFKHCFRPGKERNTVVLIFGAFYCVWFWYQMDVNWNMTYVSDVLGWYF